jgi:hypothetical protein
MKQNIDPNFIHFPTHFDAAPRGADGQAAVASGMGAAAPDRGATPAGGPAKRGRPSDYAPRVIDMLCASIRRYGLSDSAAAEQQGMSTSTLSRWKQLHPEIGIKLKQARQEIRTFHLDRIMEHAAREDGKGWRASTWILERLFPGDYSPRMKERNAYLNLEDRLHDKEAHEAHDERLRELHEKQAEERAAWAAAQAAEAAAEVPGGVAPTAAGDSRRDAEAPNAKAEAENCASASVDDSRNSRNSVEAEPALIQEATADSEVCDPELKEPGRPRPTDSNGAAAHSITLNVHNAHEHPQGSAASPLESTGRGRPNSLNGATHAEASWFYSVGDSQNSRNSAAPVFAFSTVAPPASAAPRP